MSSSCPPPSENKPVPSNGPNVNPIPAAASNKPIFYSISFGYKIFTTEYKAVCNADIPNP